MILPDIKRAVQVEQAKVDWRVALGGLSNPPAREVLDKQASELANNYRDRVAHWEGLFAVIGTPRPLGAWPARKRVSEPIHLMEDSAAFVVRHEVIPNQPEFLTEVVARTAGGNITVARENFALPNPPVHRFGGPGLGNLATDFQWTDRTERPREIDYREDLAVFGSQVIEVISQADDTHAELVAAVFDKKRNPQFADRLGARFAELTDHDGATLQ